MNSLSYTRKTPATELLDQDFHAEIANSDAISTYSSWTADCYDAIMSYRRATDANDKQTAALRIGQTAWEAAEANDRLGKFLSCICDNWMAGLKAGRMALDWLKMEWTEEVESHYVAKSLRHFIQSDTAITLDDKIKHLAALFCNANILWRRCDD